jgi:capsular exopolysaccharide synthesis family protein
MRDAAASNEQPEGGMLPMPVGPRGQYLTPLDPRMQALSTLVRSNDGEPAEKEIDLLEYWRIILKRKWTVLGAFAIVLLTGLMATLLTTPIFRATAVVQIERQSMRVVNVPGVDPIEAPYDREFYETQFQLLQSRTMAEKVVADLDPDDPVFAIMGAPTPWRKLVDMVMGRPAAAPNSQDSEAKRSQLVGLVRGGLSIEPVANSRLARIHFDSPDGGLCARVANAIAEGFIDSNMERRIDTSSYAKEFLEDRLEQVKVKLQDSEKALADFATKERFVDIGDRKTLLSSDLGSLNGALMLAKQERINAEAQLRQGAGNNAMSHPFLMNNDGVQALRATRAKLSAEYQEKLLTFKPAYPLMQQLKSQMSELDKQLEAEVQLVKTGLSGTFEAARAKEAMLQEQVDKLTDQVLSVQSRSTDFTVLEREVETSRQLYDALLQRYKEIGITSNVDANNISIVDSALVPGAPYKPDLRRNLLTAGVAGLMLGILLAFVFEFLDDTLKRPDEIEKHLGIAVLGIIPKLDPGMSPEEAAADPRSGFSESYRSVRTSLQFATEDGVPKCLLVTSPSASEGKSTTAISLARNFAQLGRRVLLIDGDLRNPSLHKILGSDNSVGLSNYLAGGIKPSAAIKPTKTLRLTFIPSGPLPPNPAELLAGPKMVSLLTLAMEKFDQVVIDGPPIMGLADSPILSNLSSGTLLVIEAGASRVAIAKAALKRLLGARAHVVGALLTKFDARIGGYGYGGAYNYSHYYSYGGSDTKSLPKS